ncbi:hypothetical protein [Aeoliella mucimassa]|uniref:hypothetical protein n=1 Tax=Aeoliella mucimassa TaxID=2527972 RepID=UPI001E441477|nr:hypothetical protein [Aeoliella mucimassa]
MATVTPDSTLVEANEPRYGDDRLVVGSEGYTVVLSNLGSAQLTGSGWDHDGTTPLAVLIDHTSKQIYFVKGDDFQVVSRTSFGSDILKGSVSGYSYEPLVCIVHEGLVVFCATRFREEAGSYIEEGISFIYTQDYGQTYHRVAQVGGGYDVPAIEGGVTDGLDRVNDWSFSNAFPEKSADDQLGAWFPWADYLYKEGNPHGGQIGLFRARREAVGELWVVEPNVTVYERWEVADSGGFHAHSAGMFTDGMVSFWGDVDYRNNMTRHVAEDLENYTTTTWTTDTEFHGGWSASDDKEYVAGNQGASTAPGPVYGEVLVAGDVQPEIVMSINAPTQEGENVTIEGLLASYPGRKSGNQFTGREAIWIHYLPGRGYVVRETERGGLLEGGGATYYSSDGVNWTTLLNYNLAKSFLYGDYVIQGAVGEVVAMRLESRAEVFSPLLINPGGTNLMDSTWEALSQPSSGNTVRQVNYVDGLYVYADNGQALSPQPDTLPPVMSSSPMYEITVTNTSVRSSLGRFDIAGLVSDNDENHWFTSWVYPLDNSGVLQSAYFPSNSGSERGVRWVANDDWYPAYTWGVPNSSSTGESEQTMQFMAAGASRWLVAGEGLVEDISPTYPLAPESTGSDEIATVTGFTTSDAWTIGMVFGLPQVASFSLYTESAVAGTYRPIATLYQDEFNYIEVNFVRYSKSECVLTLDVYSDGTLAGSVEFDPIYMDLLDHAQLAIASSDSGVEATLFLPRYTYGVQSASNASLPHINPNQVMLSRNATGDVVSPLEWFSVKVEPDDALSQEMRELFVVDDAIYSVTPWLAGDFNLDGVVNLGDYTSWRDTFGMTVTPCSMSDCNLNGVIDSGDYAIWKTNYGKLETARFLTSLSSSESTDTDPEASAAVAAVVGGTTVADTSAEDTSVADTSVAATSIADTTATNTSGSDTSNMEPSIMDAGVPETSAAETSVADTSAVETAVGESFVVDTTLDAVDAPVGSALPGPLDLAHARWEKSTSDNQSSIEKRPTVFSDEDTWPLLLAPSTRRQMQQSLASLSEARELAFAERDDSVLATEELLPGLLPGVL